MIFYVDRGAASESSIGDNEAVIKTKRAVAGRGGWISDP
jgi:hypothetical protein